MRQIILLLLLCPLLVSAQSWQWAITSVGTETQGASDVATDRMGNIYMTGYSAKNYVSDPANNIAFGTTIIASSAVFYNYLVKINPSGIPLWIVSVPGDGNLYVATDTGNNVFIAGSFYGSITLGGYSLSAPDTIASNVFLAKLDSTGTALWLVAGTGAGNAGGTPSALCTDLYGNAIVSGTISDSITFNTLTLTTHDLFIVKFNANGNLKWGNTVGGHPRLDSSSSGILFPDEITGIMTDRTGKILFAGAYKADTFYAGTFAMMNRSAGGTNSFLFKTDTSGNTLWTNAIGGATSVTGAVFDFIFGAAIDGAGNCYVTGATNSDVLYIGANAYINSCACGQQLFAKITAAGSVEWQQPSVFPGGSPATNGSFGLGLAAHDCDAIYMIGLTSDAASFGPFLMDSTYYIVKFDTSGAALAAANAGDLNYFMERSIVVDTANNAFVTGYYMDACSIGSQTLSLTGSANAFLAKYSGDSSTAVPIANELSVLALFPDPAIATLHIASDHAIHSFAIYNLAGCQVYSAVNSTNVATIDVSGFTPGIYLIKTDDGIVRQFVKQ